MSIEILATGKQPKVNLLLGKGQVEKGE